MTGKEGNAGCNEIYLSLTFQNSMRQTEKVKEMLGLAEKNSLFSELLCSNRQLKVLKGTI